jgi:hypothetical protein
VAFVPIVTVAQSINPSEITIASRGFDNPDKRSWFLMFLHGSNSPIATTCAAGIQTVRLKGPGVFFGFNARETAPGAAAFQDDTGHVARAPAQLKVPAIPSCSVTLRT